MSRETKASLSATSSVMVCRPGSNSRPWGGMPVLVAGETQSTHHTIDVGGSQVVLSIQKPDLTDPVDACNWIHYSIRSESTGSDMADRVLATDTQQLSSMW